jgi:hypothetical protein
VARLGSQLGQAIVQRFQAIDLLLEKKEVRAGAGVVVVVVVVVAAGGGAAGGEGCRG